MKRYLILKIERRYQTEILKLIAGHRTSGSVACFKWKLSLCIFFFFFKICEWKM